MLMTYKASQLVRMVKGLRNETSLYFYKDYLSLN